MSAPCADEPARSSLVRPEALDAVMALENTVAMSLELPSPTWSWACTFCTTSSAREFRATVLASSNLSVTPDAPASKAPTELSSMLSCRLATSKSLSFCVLPADTVAATTSKTNRLCGSFTPKPSAAFTCTAAAAMSSAVAVLRPALLASTSATPAISVVTGDSTMSRALEPGATLAEKILKAKPSLGLPDAVSTPPSAMMGAPFGLKLNLKWPCASV